MKLSLELTGPAGKMWDNVSTYYNLPEIYAWEIASVAVALASYIENTAGNATGDEKAYTVSFKVQAEGKEPKLPENVPHTVKAEHLLYSQAVDIQDQGLALLLKLQQSAHMEIKSGLRT